MRKLFGLELLVISCFVILVLAGLALLASQVVFRVSDSIYKAPLITDLIPVDAGGYTIGQNFSAAEEAEIVRIASTDPFMTGSIWFDERETLYDGYRVARVTADKYFDRVPDHAPDNSLWLPRYRVLPVVIFNVGNPDYEGIDLFTFVDPDKKYVTYKGYVVRPGLKGEDSYAVLEDGVREENVTNGWLSSTVWSDNVSIAYTAFIPPKKLTGPQKAELLNVVLNDSRVKRALDGNVYQIEGITSDTEVAFGPGGGYYLAYHAVEFTVTYDGEQVPLMKVTVDGANKRVVEIRPWNSPPGENVTPYSMF